MMQNMSIKIIFIFISLHISNLLFAQAPQKNEIPSSIKQAIQYQFLSDYISLQRMDSLGLVAELACVREIVNIETVPIKSNTLILPEGNMFKISFFDMKYEDKSYVVWVCYDKDTPAARSYQIYRLKGFMENDYPRFRTQISVKNNIVVLDPINSVLHWKRQQFWIKSKMVDIVPVSWRGYSFQELISESPVDFDCLENAYRQKGKKYCDCLVSYQHEYDYNCQISSAPTPYNEKQLREKAIMGRFLYEDKKTYSIQGRLINLF